MNLTLSHKQKKSIRESDARLNFWIGAVRSGKSFASIIRFIEFCLTGPMGDLAIVGKSIGAIKRNVLSPLKHLLGDEFQFYLGKGEATFANRTIHLVGANDERAETKIRGSSFAGAYVDEVTIIPESVFSMLISRLSIPGAKLFGTTNPDSPFHWFKKNYLDRGAELDLKQWDFVLEDNPSLDPVFVHNLKREYQGLWYERFIEGKWVLAEGTIFDFFDRNLHTLDLPPGMANYYVVGVDYGTTNPCAFTMVGYSDRTFPTKWVEKEYYWDSKVKLRQKSDTEYAKDLQKFIEGYRVKTIYIDPSAASFKLELTRSLPGYISLIEANNDVLDGIRYLSMQISNGTLKILKNCQNLLNEMGTYRWDMRAADRGEDKPLKENDHAIDSLRYAVVSEWYKKEGPRMTAEDLERLRYEAMGLSQHGKFFDDKLW